MRAACVADPARILLRPWRDGAFRVLALSLFVAAVALSAVLLLRAELESRFDRRTAEMLGGDLVLDASRPPDPRQRALLAGTVQSMTVKFRTVLIADDDLLLVGVKAVDDAWPLYGRVRVSDTRFGDEYALDHGPRAGEVWVAGQVLDRLALAVGAEVTIGELTLPVTRVVRQEPDQGASFYGMTPRVLMHLDDLPATGILGAGSQASHDLLLRTDDPRALRRALAPTLRPDQKIEDIHDGQTRSLGPLRQLTLWIGLGVLLIALLCGAAIWLTTGLRVARRARLAALLRAFGASRRTVLGRLLGTEFLAILPPVAAGIAAGSLLVLTARRLLDWNEPLAAGPWQWSAVVLAPLVLFVAFAVPRLLTLVQVPAIQVLNRGSAGTIRRSGLELAAALLGPVLLGALLMGSLAQLARLLAVLAGLAVLLPLLLWPLLRVLDRVSIRWPVARRLALRRLSRRPATTLPLLASLALAMAILTLAGLSGSELLAEWRRKLPEQAPNHFVINLFDADRETFRAWIDEAGARPEPLYPVVRGRLTEINGVPVREAVTKEDDDDRGQRALNRDLSLTENAALPASNVVRRGAWHGTRPGEVSVEAELAASLGLDIGDVVTFVTSRGELSAPITSIRAVDWESFVPNFYFMFSPGTFDDQDRTWMTAFWLPEGTGRQLAMLMQRLPHITLLDVNALLDQAQTVVAQASRATALLAALLILASLLVLFAALLATGHQRRLDQALLRALGARRALLGRINRLEFLLLGSGAALVALVLVFAALTPLAVLLFDGRLPWSWWLWLPAALGLLVVASGLFAVRGQYAAPGALLKDDG